MGIFNMNNKTLRRVICYDKEDVNKSVSEYEKKGWKKVGKIKGRDGLYFQDIKIKDFKLWGKDTKIKFEEKDR